MTPEQIRHRMMEKLYGTLSPDEEHELHQHLQQDETLHTEWEHVRAAHQALQNLRRPEASPAVIDRLQHAARSEKPASAPGHWLRGTAMAASILALVSVSWWYVGTGGEYGNAIAIYRYENQSPAPHIDETQPVPPSRNLPAESSPAEVRLAGDVRQQTANDRAEELFRVGLANYNNAFAKIGSEKETLLRSAIIHLNDVYVEYPDADDWVALARMLIADAHRELNEPEKAILSYQTVIEQCSEHQSFCRKARHSALQLMTHNKRWLPQATRYADELVRGEPLTLEETTTLLTFARQCLDSRPGEVIAWMDAICDRWNASSPLHEKALRLRKTARFSWVRQNAIQPWVRSIPVPKATTYSQLITRQGEEGLGNEDEMLFVEDLPWTRLDHASRWHSQVASASGRALFFITHVHADRERVLYLARIHEDGSQVFLNGEPMQEHPVSTPDNSDPPVFLHGNLNLDGQSLVTFPVHLNPGWNELVCSVLVPESAEAAPPEVSIALLDSTGQVPGGLHVAATRNAGLLPESLVTSSIQSYDRSSLEMEETP